MDIGRRIKTAREAIGYTLEKASQQSGIGKSSLSEFENSKREPKFSQLARLAEVYRKSIDFFLSDELPAVEMPLWREPPENEEEKKQIEARFLELCQQYHNLELIMNEHQEVSLPKPEVDTPQEFNYKQAERLARKVHREFGLGEIPSASLKQTLEEKYYVKIFHLVSSGSAVSIVSEVFGPAILLDKNSKLWRRNFDLAHELFHILTWQIFRTTEPTETQPSEFKEKLASAFASRLLLPTDSVKDKIDSARDKSGLVRLDALDEIAREFGVSLDALLWRTLYLYNKSDEDVQQYLEKAQVIKTQRPRHTDEPDELPERYLVLGQLALKRGRMSLMAFKKYMGISYKKAQEYLTEDEDFKDEKVSIPIT